MKRKHFFYLILIIFLFCLSVPYSFSYTIYKWKDSTGAVNYSDKKPETDAEVIEIIKTRKKSPVIKQEEIIIEEPVVENDPEADTVKGAEPEGSACVEVGEAGKSRRVFTRT